MLGMPNKQSLQGLSFLQEEINTINRKIKKEILVLTIILANFMAYPIKQK